MRGINPKGIRLMTNMVLIKPFLLSTEKIELNGLDLWLDGSFDVEKHSATTGEVVRVCEKIFFSKKVERGMANKSCRFGTTIEMKPGDKVYFHYLSIMNARKDGRLIKADDGEYYMFMKYDEAFCVKRKEEIVMVNGWMLMEPIEADKKYKSKLIEIPEFINKEKSLKVARVCHVGSRLTGYTEDINAGEDFPHPVKRGDVVAFEKYSDIPLQYDLFNDLEGKKIFYRMQRKDICAIIDDPEFEVTE